MRRRERITPSQPAVPNGYKTFGVRQKVDGTIIRATYPYFLLCNGPQYRSLMYDDLGRSKDHACVHTQTWFEDASPVTVSLNTRYKNGETHSGVVELYPGITPQSFLPLHAELPSITDAIDDINSQRKNLTGSGLDLALGIYEFRQTLSLINSLKELLTRWPNLTMKALANRHLEYNFGVLPTLSDLKALFRLPSVIEKSLKDSGGIVKLYHRSTTNGVTNDLSQKDSWSCTLTVSQPVRLKTGYIPSIGRILASYMGLNRPLESIWNAVPYSFLVDWFVSFGDVIRSIQDQLLEDIWVPAGPLVITTKRQVTRQYWAGFAVNYVYYNAAAGYYHTLVVNPGPNNMYWVPGPSYNTAEFIRSLNAPSNAQLDLVGQDELSISNRRLSLLLALIAQRVK